MNTNILGLYGCIGWQPEDAWLHSAGASLWAEGKHVCTISEERLTRKKYDGNYPEQSIKYVLEEADIDESCIDIIAYAENIHSPVRHEAIIKILKREFKNAEVRFINHHIAHASASFFSSGFNRASILTFDGAGNSFHYQCPGASCPITEYETGFYGVGDKKLGITVIDHFRNGLRIPSRMNMGQIYNNMSRYIYSQMEPEKAENIDNPFIFMESAPGKIMGLAAYGDSDAIDMSDLFVVNEEPWFPTIEDNVYPTDKQLSKYSPEDLAAWLQKQFEDIIILYFKELKLRKLTEKKLCLAGGCALNVLTNSKIMATEIFDDMFVFPASNDTGLCFGAAIYCCNREREKIVLPENVAFLGREYKNEEIYALVKETKWE